ncbi:carbamoyltransferase N-terminal domain-containing protein [Candidatus Tisiphia endosymbiont of Xenochironomus xenolabis]|jgi:carbamoyltransferase|uniref:carbamoyltransferase N-terminal domain-containing protein n=1 Tax=unclassified Candidatus Tisiphia TaxID=2996318 RepID=UPI0035C88170
MNVIGISSHFHDSACALLKDGKLVAAAAEERFSRFKNDPRLPVRSFRYCLEEANLSIKDIDYIGFYESPQKKLSRQLQYPFASESDNEYKWLDYDLPLREIREVLGYENVIRTYDHHLSHAAASFYFSGFKESAIFGLNYRNGAKAN